MPQEATTMKTMTTTDRWAYASKSKGKKGKGYQCKFIRRQRVTMHRFRYGSHCCSECVVYDRLPHGQGNTTIARYMHWEHHRGYMCLKLSYGLTTHGFFKALALVTELPTDKLMNRPAEEKTTTRTMTTMNHWAYASNSILVGVNIAGDDMLWLYGRNLQYALFQRIGLRLTVTQI